MEAGKGSLKKSGLENGGREEVRRVKVVEGRCWE